MKTITHRLRCTRKTAPSCNHIGCFEELSRFFRQHVWTARNVEECDAWLSMVRNRRNAVHAFNHREIGSWSDWSDSVVRYNGLIDELDSRVPYPDSSDYYA